MRKPVYSCIYLHTELLMLSSAWPESGAPLSRDLEGTLYKFQLIDGGLFQRFNLRVAWSIHGTLSGMTPIQMGSGSEGCYLINSFKYEQGQCNTVVIETRAQLHLSLFHSQYTRPEFFFLRQTGFSFTSFILLILRL